MEKGQIRFAREWSKFSNHTDQNTKNQEQTEEFMLLNSFESFMLEIHFHVFGVNSSSFPVAGCSLNGAQFQKCNKIIFAQMRQEYLCPNATKLLLPMTKNHAL